MPGKIKVLKARKVDIDSYIYLTTRGICAFHIYILHLHIII